ncbi:MAG: hypothetical protein LBU32_08780 [Clostridiales bacterium]|jgi:hypothetical protein|nr:hypothetical protein [Clostridiales bacterium]
MKSSMARVDKEARLYYSLDTGLFAIRSLDVKEMNIKSNEMEYIAD